MARLRGYKDGRGWGKCSVCVSPHLEEIESIYYNDIVPAREAENARAAALGQAPYLKAASASAIKTFVSASASMKGICGSTSTGTRSKRDKEYTERPLSTYAIE